MPESLVVESIVVAGVYQTQVDDAVDVFRVDVVLEHDRKTF